MYFNQVKVTMLTNTVFSYESIQNPKNFRAPKFLHHVTEVITLHWLIPVT